jgi:hypothetical protein
MLGGGLAARGTVIVTARRNIIFATAFDPKRFKLVTQNSLKLFSSTHTHSRTTAHRISSVQHSTNRSSPFPPPPPPPQLESVLLTATQPNMHAALTIAALVGYAVVGGGRTVRADGEPLSIVGGLMVDLKPPPSLAVSRSPAFSWIVPHSTLLGVGQTQSAFRVRVSADAALTSLAWDSGVCSSNEQTFIAYTAALPLDAARRYYWQVSVVVADDAGTTLNFSSAATPLVTELGRWDVGTVPIWAVLVSPPPPPPPKKQYGRFIKACTDAWGPLCSSANCGACPIVGYPNGCMWYAPPLLPCNSQHRLRVR